MGRGELRIGDFGSWMVRGEGLLGLGIVSWELWTGDTRGIASSCIGVYGAAGAIGAVGALQLRGAFLCWAALLWWDVGHQMDIMPTGSYCCSLESIILRHADFQHELFKQSHTLFPEVGEAIPGKVVIAN